MPPSKKKALPAAPEGYVATWWCLECDAKGEGDGSDHAAEVHVKAEGHPTVSKTAKKASPTIEGSHDD